MVDVDDPTGELAAKLRRQDLDEPGQDDHIRCRMSDKQWSSLPLSTTTRCFAALLRALQADDVVVSQHNDIFLCHGTLSGRASGTA